MKKVIFKGSGVAIVTPMKDDGTVNYDVLGELIEFQIDNGTDAIISCGTTGESAVLTGEERREIVKYTIKKVNGRIPVVVGSGSNDTKRALELSKEAQELGADGLLVVTPYYNKTSQTGLIKHYDYIAGGVGIPIILYNVPSRTGCRIAPETYLELSKRPNIVATKDASGDVSSIAKTIALCGEELNVYSGNDDQIVPVTALGGIGVISVLANVAPKESHMTVSEYLSGNSGAARKLQLDFFGLIEALFSDVNPVPVKEALNMMGFNCGRCRMPLDVMSDRARENLKKEMEKHSILKN